MYLYMSIKRASEGEKYTHTHNHASKNTCPGKTRRVGPDSFVDCQEISVA